MQHEDKPFLWEATDQADHASHEGEDCCERKTPVGKAWRHRTPLFFSRVWPRDHTPSYLQYLAIHKFADMIQSFLECTWIATSDLGHLWLAATTAADDLSQFLCKLSGVVALLHQVGGYRHHELRPLIDDGAEDDDARAKAITYSLDELAQRLHICGLCLGSDVR